jgi:hypothetical protein
MVVKATKRSEETAPISGVKVNSPEAKASGATIPNPPAGTLSKKKAKGKSKKRVVKKKSPNGDGAESTSQAETESKRLQRPYPLRTLEEALVVPRKIKDEHKGEAWSTVKAAEACGYKNARSGTFFYLSTASRDYGLTVGTYNTETIELTLLGRRIVFAGDPASERKAKIEAFFQIDIFKKVFSHYGGSKFPPEKQYVSNTLHNDFGLAPELHDEFIKIYSDNCKDLSIENGLGDVLVAGHQDTGHAADIRVVGQPRGKFDRTAFVIMPFSERGILKRSAGFFSEVLRTLVTPAGNDAGFAIETAEGQGSDVIQSTIINQLLNVELVIADLTDHNPNVLFELGIRIAKDLPVALIKSSDTDKIFDVDNMMRYLPYDPNLWSSTVEKDRAKLTEHIKGAWDNRGRNRSYMQILTGDAKAMK